MIAIAITVILAGSSLFAQHQAHQNRRDMRWDRSLVTNLRERICILESERARHFDAAAFEDLKNKVEAMRFGNGLRSQR